MMLAQYQFDPYQYRYNFERALNPLIAFFNCVMAAHVAADKRAGK